MAYIGKTPSQAVRSRYFYTASGGETSFSGADDNGNSLVYTDGNYVDVYLNGVLLVAGSDYNTNTTNTVAGVTAVAASDIVEIVVYDTFSVFGGDVLGDFTISNGNFTANSLIYPTADGTSGQFMTTDGSGNLSFATVNTNLVADLTPQLGGTLDANGNSIDMGTYTITDAKVGQWDTAYGWGDHSTQNYAVTTGDTMTGNLDFGDNVYARFGASNDLKIFHTGSSSNIQDSGTGNLNISGDDVVILNAAATETKATFASNGAVTLYYDNNAKITTKIDGVDITGELQTDTLDVDSTSDFAGKITLHADFDMQDNDKILIGTDDDLQIYHDGTHSYIYENGTGSLRVRATEFDVQQLSNGNSVIKSDGSSAQLLENGSLKLETTANGVTVTGNVDINGGALYLEDNQPAYFGYSNDLQIYHDGTDSVIKDTGTGNLVLTSNGGGIFFRNNEETETYANFNNNGSVQLRYDNSPKLETTSSGVTVTGTLTTDGVSLGDGEYIQLGASNDLQIYHDGSNSNIKDNGTGNLKLLASNFALQNSTATHNAITYTNGGAVSLMHNNSKKFETSAAGAIVTGTLTATSFSGDGSALTGISGGKVLQVVQHTFSNQNTQTSSTSFVSTWMTGAITPSSTSSKILVFANASALIDAYSNQGINSEYAIFRGGTNVYALGITSWTDSGSGGTSINFLDSPSTTSAVTYNIRIRNVSTYGGQRLTAWRCNVSSGTDASLILMEIGT